MRRVAAMLGSAVILLAGGCGLNSYEARLNQTLERMKYEDRLNKMLMPASTDKEWQEYSIYLRPPKSLAPAKEFFLTAPEPGKFEIEKTFLEAQKQSLHVLARLKLAKNAAKKKAAPSPADTADRTNFNKDIIDLVTSSYSPPEELILTKFKVTNEKSNEYKWTTFEVNGKNVQIYLYKKDQYEVALIFEFPKADQSSLTGKIKLCLESFAVGDKAKRYFSGGGGEDEAVGANPGVAF